MLNRRRSWRGRLLAAGLLLMAGPPARWAPPAHAALSDCAPPGSHAPNYGCVWTGPNYTGAMKRYEGDGRNPGAGCLNESPRSAVNNGRGGSGVRYRFKFYNHPDCEKGGKAFGVLGPQQSDPDLPAVLSYAWARYTG